MACDSRATRIFWTMLLTVDSLNTSPRHYNHQLIAQLISSMNHPSTQKVLLSSSTHRLPYISIIVIPNSHQTSANASKRWMTMGEICFSAMLLACSSRAAARCWAPSPSQSVRGGARRKRKRNSSGEGEVGRRSRSNLESDRASAGQRVGERARIQLWST